MKKIRIILKCLLITFILLAVTQKGWGQTDPLDDYDGDGIANIDDLDDDNDGITDIDEEGQAFIDFSSIVSSATGDTYSYTRPSDGLVITGDLNIDAFGNIMGGTNRGELLLGGGDGVDINTGSLYTLNFSFPVVIQITAQRALRNVGGAFNNGDIIRFTTVGGFTLEDPDNQLVVLNEVAGSSVTITPAGSFNFRFTQGNWSITTNDPVTSFTYQGTGDPRVVARIHASMNVDMDGDGILNRFDLDSDGDGCPDALEGARPFTVDDLVLSSLPGGNTGAGYTGTSTAEIQHNFGNDVSTSGGNIGIPIATGSQGLGNSLDGTLQDAACAFYNPFEFKHYMRHGKYFRDGVRQPMEFGRNN